MKRCALIVDDSRLGRLMLQTYILQFDDDWQIILANDGPEAISKISGPKIDVMFIDYNMPGMDGLELIDRLRDEGVSAPSALVTANVQDAVR